MKEKTIKVLKIAPHCKPEIVTLINALESLQEAVSEGADSVGLIEIIPITDTASILCNEEGKLNGSELNRALRDEDGHIYDILAGDFLIVGLGEEDFSSLSPELMAQFEKQFHQPEMFVKLGRSIMALPLPDDKVKKPDAPEKSDIVPKKSTPDRDAL